jgi:hypothetical protein
MEKYYKKDGIVYVVLGRKAKIATLQDVSGDTITEKGTVVRSTYELTNDAEKTSFENSYKEVMGVSVDEAIKAFLEKGEILKAATVKKGNAKKETATTASSEPKKKRKLLFTRAENLRNYFLKSELELTEGLIFTDNSKEVDAWAEKTIEALKPEIDFGQHEIAVEDLTKARDNSRLSFYENRVALAKSKMTKETFEDSATDPKEIEKYKRLIKMALMNFYKASTVHAIYKEKIQPKRGKKAKEPKEETVS